MCVRVYNYPYMNLSQKSIFSWVGVVIVLAAGAYLLFANTSSHRSGGDLDPTPRNVTLAGTYVCLPHLDMQGAQSEECAFGLKTDSGEYYAVNFGASADAMRQFESRAHIAAEGFVVIREALSSDHWAKYNMKGIFTITHMLSPSTSTAQTEAGIECHDSERHLFIQKDLKDSVGSDILVKYKSTADQNIPCAYTVADGDFEIKNTQAEYFLAFTDNYLVLDSGTAPPPRGLIVYDLRSRKQVFTDMYTKPVAVAGDTITYLSKTAEKPTSKNCPELSQFTQNGLGAVMMTRVSVDLATLKRTILGPSQCMATQ